MKTLFTAFSYIALASVALCERTILTNSTGSVQLPPGYVNIDMSKDILRPKDSTNSAFRKDDEVVSFDTTDQGKLVQYALEYFPKQKKVLTHWTSEVNGNLVTVLVWEHAFALPEGGAKLSKGGAVVSYPELKVDFACDYIHQGHLVNFLFIALSYQKYAEQGGTGQPATRPESKPLGGDKPQPESEGRSR